MKDLGSSFSGNNYESTCRTIYEQLQNDIKALTEFYKQELDDFEA